jgi:lysine 2,3-aminomutase
LDYDPGEIVNQENLIERRPEPGQEGIMGLLGGDRMTIEPDGFAETHSRGGKEHRLRSGETADKWRPLGVGTIEPDKEEPKKLADPTPEDEQPSE